MPVRTVSGAGMKYEWILDVIADLKSFAAVSDLPRLAAELEEVHLIAAMEIAQRLAQEETPQSAANPAQRPHS